MATINGTAGDDLLLGTPGQDAISGFEGADTIDGGAGSDRITSGAGDDEIRVGFGYGLVEVVPTGGGNDTLWLTTSLFDVATVRTRLVDRVPGPGSDEFFEIFLVDGTRVQENQRPDGDLNRVQAMDSVLVQRSGSAPGEVDPPGMNLLVSGHDSGSAVIGGSGHDILYGDGGADTLQGNAGNDYLAAGVDDGAADLFDGGGGINTISYSGTGSNLTIDIGRNYAQGSGMGRDQVLNMQVAVGSLADDVLIGRADAGDTLHGYWGNDYLYGLGGHDVLLGGTATTCSSVTPATTPAGRRRARLSPRRHGDEPAGRRRRRRCAGVPRRQ